jgi:hypothetical protein
MRTTVKHHLPAVLIAVGGMIGFLSSCEKEINSPPEIPVSLNFMVTGRPYGSDQTVVRSSASPNRDLERVDIPLADHWLLSAGWEEEPASPSRAADEDEIIDGAACHVVAYRHNGSTYAYESDASYTYDYDTQTLIKVGSGIEVTAGQYMFAIYTYNTTTDLGYSTTDSGAEVLSYDGTNTNSLMWSVSGPVTVSAGSSPVINAE